MLSYKKILIITLVLLCFMSFLRAFTPLLSRTSIPVLKTSTRKMHIESIPMWTGSGNNYAYLVTDDKTKESVIIDPANPPE